MTTDAAAAVRESLASLDVQRKALEHEADAIYLELTTPPSDGVEAMGVDTPLVDSEGYPRGDIDLYRARSLRQRFQILRTDHKQTTQKIEEMLVQLAALQNPSKTAAERKEKEARSATKPKPKYDPITGKWVVMNWDGTVAGVPNGDQRSFAALDRSVSALTGDTDDTASSAPPADDSTRSTATADAEPRPDHADDADPFCRVDAVASESPAAAAGLKEEDLILRFGPLDVGSPLRAIAELVPRSAAAGDAIPLEILRRGDDDRWDKLTLQLSPRPWNGRGLLGCHIVPYQSPSSSSSS